MPDFFVPSRSSVASRAHALLNARMKQILADASARAIRYLEGLDARAVAPTPAAVAQLALLNTPVPAKSSAESG